MWVRWQIDDFLKILRGMHLDINLNEYPSSENNTRCKIFILLKGNEILLKYPDKKLPHSLKST